MFIKCKTIVFGKSNHNNHKHGYESTKASHAKAWEIYKICGSASLGSNTEKTLLNTRQSDKMMNHFDVRPVSANLKVALLSGRYPKAAVLGRGACLIN